MSVATDIDTEIYEAIWTALVDDVPWAAAIETNNRIRYDFVTGTQNPNKPASSDVDYPQATLYPPVSGTDGLFTDDVNFGTYSSEGPSNWREVGTRIFRLTVISQLLSQQEWSNLNTLSRNALRNAGPRLGTSFLQDVSLRWTVSDTDVNSTDQTRRIKCVIDIFVRYDVPNSLVSGD